MMQVEVMPSKSFPVWLQTIRVRLTLWYLLILGITLFIFALGIFIAGVINLENAAQNKLTSIADEISATYSESGQRIKLQDQPLTSGIANGDLPAFLIVNPRGQVINQMGPLTALDLATIQKRTAEQRSEVKYLQKYAHPDRSGREAPTTDYLVLLTPVQSHGHIVGTLLLGLSRQGLNGNELLLLISLAASWLGILSLSTIGGYWLSLRAMRPVSLLTQAANEIGETDLSRRIPLQTHDELGMLAMTFNRMLSRLEAAFERQRQFTSDASHELRTPLSIIDLEVSRGLAQSRSAEAYEQILRTIQAESTHMTRLINDLLTLGRADSNNISLHLEPLDLSDIALEVIERLSPLARQQQIELRPGELPELPVCGDRLQLCQAMTNLVENAIKYSSGTGSFVSLNLSRREVPGGNDLGIIRITDNGPGIAASHLPHLFDRFYQVDRARHHDTSVANELASEATQPTGSGLGLAITHWIVQAHHGTIQVFSQQGQGSTFEIHLPLA